MKRYGKLFDSGYWLDAQWWYPEEDFMQLGESYDAQGIAYNAIAADNAKKVENFYNLTKQHEKLLAARDLAALASATLREESIAKNDRIRALEAELNEQARVNGMGGSREAALLAKVARLEAALRESGEQLRMGAYHVGELGMAWTATIVTPECQKIQRTLKAAHLASVTALETKGDASGS